MNPPKPSPVQIHGTCLELAGAGILITGPSGSGKSDLALRLMEAGASLVGDDRIDLSHHQGQLVACPPRALRGLLEVRQVGILRFPFVEKTVLRAVVRLGPAQPENRLPPEQWIEIAGARLRCFEIDPWQPSAAMKVRLVSRLVTGSINRIDD